MPLFPATGAPSRLIRLVVAGCAPHFQTRPTLHPTLYRRLRWLWPVVAHPLVRRASRLFFLGMLALWFVFAGLVLGLRHVVLPAIGDYQPQIERLASEAIGMPVHIGRIDASWSGLNPRLVLNDVALTDTAGRPAFSLSQVETVLSWQTLLRARLTLSLLAVDGPVLNVRRDRAGRITVAGVSSEGEADPAVADWILSQARIRIRNATVVWEDAARQAPPLVLEDLQFGLDNRGRRHRFSLLAVPPERLAARIDLRGEFRGDVGDALHDLSGKVYVELDYADLAGWQDWVDYPVALPEGRGALRFWAGLKHGRGDLAADVALEDLTLGLSPELPQLQLASLRGRLKTHIEEFRQEFSGKALELSTRDGLRIAPTDFQLALQGKPGGGQAVQGSATYLDLDAMRRLALHLPLPGDLRQKLQRLEPHGQLADLRFSWEQAPEKPLRYALHTRFAGLGLLPDGALPGGAGLSGEIDASERGGSVHLESKASALMLPTVFPEPRVAFSALSGRAKWSFHGAATEVLINALSFESPDVAGSAQGRYRHSGEGPGEIDLTGRIERAAATAVWRYLPRVVNQDTRNWLRRGLQAGVGRDGKLVLKGDLRHFPFRDKSQGEFRITARAEGVKLDYGVGWPAITGIDADMEFGIGMRIQAKRGQLLGAQIGPVETIIPDFAAGEEHLRITGEARGPTAQFLAFIAQSPVSQRIDRFTEDMRASGNGQLKIAIDMPLRHVNDSRVKAEYQFINNRVEVIPGLPPLKDVNGRLAITENSVTAEGISAEALGGPMKLVVKNEGDKMQVNFGGTANLDEVARHVRSPLWSRLSGSAPWQGEVRVRKRSADYFVESSLSGVESRLPAPFAKSAQQAMPLRFEKMPRLSPDGKPVAGADQLRFQLGDVARGLIHRRLQGDAMQIERGLLSVGNPAARMPEQGVTLAVASERFDADAWRLLASESGTDSADRAGNNGAEAPFLPALASVLLQSPEVRLFGRDVHQVKLTARPRDGAWLASLESREASGELRWQGDGEGALEARFKRLQIPDAAPAAGDGDAADGAANAAQSLPALDIQAEDFWLGSKRLGRLEVKAKNTQGMWHLDQLQLTNPDGKLKGRGVWQQTGGQQTRLEFTLDAPEAGKLLDRLGYPGSMRRGEVSLNGRLSWNGPLTQLHHASLNGDFALQAENGQFAKVNPGVGKLLGILSLQALPRRLTLDFRDIFSDGLAFDRIEGRFAVQEGIVHSLGDLKMDGPSAHILISGEASLKDESQNLLVTVQPEMGSLLSVGALALAHPVAGAAALVANKLLQNPLDKAFSFQYRVTGNWDDPQVEKVGQSLDEIAPKKPAEVRKTP